MASALMFGFHVAELQFFQRGINFDVFLRPRSIQDINFGSFSAPVDRGTNLDAFLRSRSIRGINIDAFCTIAEHMLFCLTVYHLGYQSRCIFLDRGASRLSTSMNFWPTGEQLQCFLGSCRASGYQLRNMFFDRRAFVLSALMFVVRSRSIQCINFAAAFANAESPGNQLRCNVYGCGAASGTASTHFLWARSIWLTTSIHFLRWQSFWGTASMQFCFPD